MLTIQNIGKLTEYHIHHGQWSSIIIKVVDIHTFPTYYDLTIQHQSQYHTCTIQREYSILLGYAVECNGRRAMPDADYLFDILHVLHYIASFVLADSTTPYTIEDKSGKTICNQSGT